MKKSLSYRDSEWLENMLADIWLHHFSDIRQDNEVVIKWGRKARRRLGSISQDPEDKHTSIITVNRIFQDLEVPEEIIKATIVHEMTHYAHGFNSPLAQKHRHPHSGGVIKREFAERGLEELYVIQKCWLKANWERVLAKYFPPSTRVRRTPSSPPRHVPLPWWMRGV